MQKLILYRINCHKQRVLQEFVFFFFHIHFLVKNIVIFRLQSKYYFISYNQCPFTAVLIAKRNGEWCWAMNVHVQRVINIFQADLHFSAMDRYSIFD